jgi:hypothetical protein
VFVKIFLFFEHAIETNAGREHKTKRYGR